MCGSSRLDPGKYPINPYTHKVINVPTANVVLNWATGKTEAHKLDANLSTISVRSADGFKFNLDVSQIIHIPRNDAPKVIARFGDMSALVTQVLEPTIGNYFRNAAQGSDIIDFLKHRSTRQEEARTAIAVALREYNVGAVDTLIGDIVPPDQLMKTLTDRKIAEQERVTYETQRQAQEVKQQLEQATALAATQAKVVDAERQVAIAEFNARASVKSAEGQSQAKKINADADATVLRTVGDAEAAKTQAVGGAEAEVIKLKIASMESGNYALVQVAQALANAGVKLVPDIVAGGGALGGGTLVDVLLASVIRDRNGVNGASAGQSAGNGRLNSLGKSGARMRPAAGPGCRTHVTSDPDAIDSRIGTPARLRHLTIAWSARENHRNLCQNPAARSGPNCKRVNHSYDTLTVLASLRLFARATAFDVPRGGGAATARRSQ